MKVASKKGKARRLQQMVRDKLLSLSPDFRKGDIESTGMGQSGEDIVLSPHARDMLPISIECKSYSKFAIYSIIDQCKENTPEGCQPVVVLKANRRKPVAVIDLDYYIALEGYRIEHKLRKKSDYED